MRQKLLLLCSQSVVFDSLQPHGLQHSRLPFFFTISRRLLKLMSIEMVMPSDHLVLCHPLLLLPSLFPSIKVFSSESGLHVMAEVLELQLQHQSLQWIFKIDFLLDWLLWSPCSPRDSLRVFSNTTIWKHHHHLLYGLTLTSIYVCWKNHSFDCIDLCQKSDVSAF